MIMMVNLLNINIYIELIILDLQMDKYLMVKKWILKIQIYIRYNLNIKIMLKYHYLLLELKKDYYIHLKLNKVGDGERK